MKALVKSIFLVLIASSCNDPAQETENELNNIAALTAVNSYQVTITTSEQMQKIQQWGHDIKQEGRVKNLTTQACQEIFAHDNVNLLRIPIYPNAHHGDGSVRENYFVRLGETSIQGNIAKWDTIAASNSNWFHIRNVAHDYYLRGVNYKDIEIDAKSYQGTWTQWRFVDAGNGWFHIERKGTQQYLRGLASNDRVELVDSDQTGSWTQWRFVNAGNDQFYIENKGHSKYLIGDGSQYDPIIAAINRAKVNGGPDLFASHKIYNSKDMGVTRNIEFGPFYTTSGVDVQGYSACLDAFMNYVYDQTGETVKYLAPRCELGNYWTTSSYIQVVNNLQHTPLIVGPEAARAVNSEPFWTNAVAEITDIKSSHNKGQDPPPAWPTSFKCVWNGETAGVTANAINEFIYEMNQSFYNGEVIGVILWGDAHLPNTNDNGKSGPLRRDLITASKYNLVKCDAAASPDAGAIAFETEVQDKFKVFYCSTNTMQFTFDQNLKPGSIPSGASNITSNSFEMAATGTSDYGIFTIEVQ